jgi:hypothetical protein
MILKSQLKIALTIFLIVLFLGQGCVGNATVMPSLVPSTTTITPTATKTSKPTHTLRPSVTQTITVTPVPPGVFVLFFYVPLVMNYDPSIWVDKSNYTEWGENQKPIEGIIIENYLQALNLKLCQIGMVGPSGFFPSPEKIIRLGNVRFQFSTLENNEFGVKIGHYIEDQSLANYNYDRYGLPVMQITAKPSEWEECRALGEEVLATLYVP